MFSMVYFTQHNELICKLTSAPGKDTEQQRRYAHE